MNNTNATSLISSERNDVILCRPYDLPDEALLHVTGERARHLLFVPQRVMVVVGKGSNPSLELNTEAVLADKVPVLRRATGGCAVVLSPEMLVASFALYATAQRKSAEYFSLFNQIIIFALAGLGITGLERAGTSDIAIRGRKIAGTSLYRNRELVFYHAVINLSGGTVLMERYLKLPPRLPDYRAGRSHAEFVSSLRAEGFSASLGSICVEIENEFQRAIRRI
jgi:lipoate---protein ligase